jgi:hypothetical protein
MDQATYKKVKSVMRTLDMGLPSHETRQAIYDMALHDLGLERVGRFEDYQLKPPGYWTFERCQKVALKYLSKTDWKNSIDSNAYSIARLYGWVDHCCGHMISKNKPRGYWTLERCKESASKYSNKTDWQKSVDSGAYGSALKNGWIDYCCGHMISKYKPHGYWTIETCQADALLYKTRTDWQVQSPAWSTAQRNGWIDLCCGHMQVNKTPKGFWTLEKCRTESIKFKTIKSWVSGHPASYHSAHKNGWIEILSEHMTRTSLHKGYWTEDRCKIDALKFQTRAEWKKNSSAYSIALRNGWIFNCTQHMILKSKPSNYWTFERCQNDALKYIQISKWRENNTSAYQAAQRKGWLDQCCTHMTKKTSAKV